MPLVMSTGAESIRTAQYFLARALDDGDATFSNLKMQKVVYYAYSAVLVTYGERLFSESMQAWPNGPVVPSLYTALRDYRSSPIDREFLRGKTLGEVASNFSPEILETLENVYQLVGQLSAFQLVVATHSERPWKNARNGLAATTPSNVPLSDADIKEEFSAADFVPISV